MKEQDDEATMATGDEKSQTHENTSGNQIESSSNRTAAPNDIINENKSSSSPDGSSQTTAVPIATQDVPLNCVPYARACATVLERDDLLPPHILKLAGLDPAFVATMELPTNSYAYSDVCQYTAHFGVDAFTGDGASELSGVASEQESPVKQQTHDVIKNTEQTSSKNSSAKKNKHVLGKLSNAVIDERVPLEVRPLLEQGVGGSLLPRRMGPGKLSTLALPDESENESLHLADSSDNSDSDDSNGSLTDPGSDLDAWYDGVPKYSNVPDQENDQSQDNGCASEETTAEDNNQKGDGDEGIDKNSANADDGTQASADGEAERKPGRKRMSTHGLRRRRQRNVPRLCLGSGYAKVVVQFRRNDYGETPQEEEKPSTEVDDGLVDDVVLVRHLTFLDGVGIDRGSRPYRMLALASTEARALAQLCATARAWRENRRELGETPRPGRFTLYRFKTTDTGGSWENEGYKKSRPARSVILKEDMLETIISDLREFVARDTKAWYESHGLPHRRSFLFHGPPGCGKTSTIKMLAGMFCLNACFLSFSSPTFSNSALQDALAELPSRALLVLEDVDVLFNVDRKAETASSVTFSGLLNALDGLISVDGIITIFTTNHLERLDPALIRAGRVDRRFEFVHPNSKHLAKLFQSFYPDADDKLAQRFASVVLDRPEEEARSIATLQQHFIYTRKLSAKQSVDSIPKFFKEFYPKAVKDRPHFYL